MTTKEIEALVQARLGSFRVARAAKRFPSCYSKSETGCWIWLLSKSRLGYGQYWCNKKNVRAHRFSYELARGPIHPGMVVDHLCRVKHCVNPSHMEIVTNQENLLRGKRVKSCVHGHRAISHCPPCRREYTRARSAISNARKAKAKALTITGSGKARQAKAKASL